MVEIDIKAIERAFDLVSRSANGEKRGLVYQVADELLPYPYWGHLNAVLEQLIIVGIQDNDVLVAGILHDIVEDHDVTLEDIGIEFGKDVKAMVELCTKPRDFDNSDPISVEKYYHRISNYLNADERIAFGAMRIKVCDRIANLIGVQFIEDTTKKERYIIETRKYFIPMAEKVGLLDQMNNTLHFAESLITKKQ